MTESEELAAGGVVRRFAGAIAVVAGGYSLVGATGELAILLGEWFMLVLGVVAVCHGIALVGTAADRLGRANGPLVCLWAGAMIWVQARFRSTGGFADGGLWTSNPGNATWMIGLAVLSLGSGLVVAWRDVGR